MIPLNGADIPNLPDQTLPLGPALNYIYGMKNRLLSLS